MIYAVRAVRDHTGAQAFLSVERAPELEAERRFARIAGWLDGSGVTLHDAAVARDVAGQLAEGLALEQSAHRELVAG
jgi:hypothetical protein